MDQDKVAAAAPQVQEFNDLHESQPGYAGTLEIDAGKGETIVVNLWQSQKEALASLPVMGPAVLRLLVPLMQQESRLLGAGSVVANDLRPMIEAKA